MYYTLMYHRSTDATAQVTETSLALNSMPAIWELNTRLAAVRILRCSSTTAPRRSQWQVVSRRSDLLATKAAAVAIAGDDLPLVRVRLGNRDRSHDGEGDEDGEAHIVCRVLNAGDGQRWSGI